MPIIKKNEPIGKRPVIILIYGEPGIGKTSLFNTANKPLLIDFDRGVDRSILRQDTLMVRTWEDVQTEEKAGTFKDYSTIGIDTAKSALDDFLMTYVIKSDFKYQKNKLAAYGAIGDEFKIFVNNRRQEDADLVIIAHAKDEKDGDNIKKYPDVTGGSYQLLLRIADQVGYMKTMNNKRVILFEPSDNTIGKNVARLPIVEVPNESEPGFQNFMSDLITRVKDALMTQSEAQREAVVQADDYKAKIAAVTTPDELTDLLVQANALPEFLKAPLKKLIGEKAKEHAWIPNKETKRFEGAVKPTEPAKTEEPVKEAEKPAEQLPGYDFETRAKMIEDAGAAMGSEDFQFGSDIMDYDTLAGLSDSDFNELVGKIAETVKGNKPKRTYTRKQTA